MKIPVPKESVTQIMNDYDCSDKKAAQAWQKSLGLQHPDRMGGQPGSQRR